MEIYNQSKIRASNAAVFINVGGAGYRPEADEKCSRMDRGRGKFRRMPPGGPRVRFRPKADIRTQLLVDGGCVEM